MQGKTFRLREIRSPQIAAFDRDKTVFLVPVSPLEEHGPHLPIGTDLDILEATTDGLAELLAQSRADINVVVAPTLTLGAWTMDLVGSIPIRESVLRDVVMDYGKALAKHGFRHVVVTNGHGGPGHNLALEEACDLASQKYGINMISPCGRFLYEWMGASWLEKLEKHLPGPLSEDEKAILKHDCHAAHFETSCMLHLRPDLVDPAYKDLPAALDFDLRTMTPGSAKTVGGGQGYMGTPATAYPALGAAYLKLIASHLADLTLKMMDGEDVFTQSHSAIWRLRKMRPKFQRLNPGRPLP